MKEIVFEVAQEADGGYTAEGIGESIFTQANSWDELRANVKEAVQAIYFDSVPPASIRLRVLSQVPESGPGAPGPNLSL
jgi:hypothetical protein